MGRRISVVVPVYHAEKSLSRCVESILFGRFKDLEVILIDDCSKDGSWEVCRMLADKYENVRCVRNEENRGVSHTRNRGLDLACGDYILFVDSDDWVSGRYAGSLLSLAEEHPDMLAICGLHFVDALHGRRQLFLWEGEGEGVSIVPQDGFFDLMARVQLQQIWNKIFRRDVIETHHLRFDESQSMGEDYQFVLDYMEVAEIRQCAVLNQPLYYYVRASENSLMSKFGQVETELGYGRLRQLLSLIGEEEPEHRRRYEETLTATKNNNVYQFCRAKNKSRKEKLAFIEKTLGDGSAAKHYRAQMLLMEKERIRTAISRLSQLPDRVRGRLQREKRDRIAARAKESWDNENISVIAQNCIGGVFYHDLGLRFLSPTVNLYFMGPDFVKFAADLGHYLSLPLEMRWGEEYPVGRLEDVEIRFMHYSSCTEALEAWERRKSRIDPKRILILSTDMEGFDDSCFAVWKSLPYPKVLFTANARFGQEAGSVFFPEYEERGCVPDLIPMREFYKDGVLMDTANAVGRYE